MTRIGQLFNRWESLQLCVSSVAATSACLCLVLGGHSHWNPFIYLPVGLLAALFTVWWFTYCERRLDRLYLMARSDIDDDILDAYEEFL